MKAAWIRPSAGAVLLALAALLVAAPAAVAQTAPADTVRFDTLLTFGMNPPAPCSSDSIWVVATSACAPCLPIRSFTRLSNNSLALVLDAMPPNVCATVSCAPMSAAVQLAPRPAQPHDLMIVHITVNLPGDSLHAGGQVHFMRSWRFPVTDTCVTPPVEHSFVGQVLVAGQWENCDECAAFVCPGVPVPVKILGTVPNLCWSFMGLSVDSLNLAPAFNVPVIDVNIRRGLGEVCAPRVEEFLGTTVLGAASAGRRPFYVREVIHDQRTGGIITGQPVLHWFTARDTCAVPPPEACVYPFLNPVSILANPACDLMLPPGGAGTIAFSAHSQGRALAGVQGVISGGAGMHILGLRPIGAAAGMHLQTQRTDFGGINFVLFADEGAPIPANVDAPILAVAVQADSGMHAGDKGWVAGAVMAASDSLAHSLPVCPIMTLVQVAARVCIVQGNTCDANADGMTNVADLVRMARCWFHPETCPDSSTGRPDCTGDGAYHLDDLFCCARAMLGGAGVDTSSRDAVRLQVSFDEPQWVNGRARVTLRIQGATEMNGALLRVRYPSDRYTPVTSSELGTQSAASAWLPLTEAGADDILVGVLRLDTDAPDEVTVPLEFTLNAGQVPGGTLSIDRGSVVAPDGAGLVVDLTHAATPMPEVGAPVAFERVDLLAGPNPSSGMTRFSVQLPREGNVDLSVYDLAGRRITTLWHGTMAAGQRDLTWDGTGVRRGMYFARLTVDGVIRTRRVVLQHTP